MERYAIPFKIEGEVEIEANSPEEAEAKFNLMHIEDVARQGELESYTAELVEQEEA